jgi:hypothetical protein
VSTSNLLPGPPPTRLPDQPAARAAARTMADPEAVAAAFPASCTAWATLAEQALDAQRWVPGYAYARVGYHRGLDALRRAGWKGSGPVPWEHEPNRGFLRCLAALARAADAIGEVDEAQRCRAFLVDADPAAAAELADRTPDG